MKQEGILPNSEIKRNTFTFNGSQKFGDKLTANGSITYTKTEGLGRYGTGYDVETHSSPLDSGGKSMLISTNKNERLMKQDKIILGICLAQVMMTHFNRTILTIHIGIVTAITVQMINRYLEMLG